MDADHENRDHKSTDLQSVLMLAGDNKQHGNNRQLCKLILQTDI